MWQTFWQDVREVYVAYLHEQELATVEGGR